MPQLAPCPDQLHLDFKPRGISMMTVDCLEEAGRSLSRLVRDADNSALGLLLSAKPNANSASYPSNAWYALRNWDTLMHYMSAAGRQKIEEKLKGFVD